MTTQRTDPETPAASVSCYGPTAKRITITADSSTAPLIHLGWDGGGVYVTLGEAERRAHELLAAVMRLREAATA